MKAAVAEKIGELCSGGGTLLPKEDGTSAQQTDPASLTVLVAMGFCGGTWDHVSFPCRVVIPQAGLSDYISPPSGVMAFYNALSCPKEITFVQGATHFDFPSNPLQTAHRASNSPQKNQP